jgi:uncharacterized membrane protein YhaH (DUF805 family)
MLRQVFSFRRLFDFKSRATRREFVLVHVGYWAPLFVLMIVHALVFGPVDVATLKGSAAALSMGLFALAGVLALVGLVPLFAVALRRLHDQGNSGVFLLLALVPVIGWLFMLIMMFYPGQSYDNDYGPDPRDTYAEFASAQG